MRFYRMVAFIFLICLFQVIVVSVTEYTVYRVSKKKLEFSGKLSLRATVWARVKSRAIFKTFKKFPIFRAQKNLIFCQTSTAK